jgi:hypothetical protein
VLMPDMIWIPACAGKTRMMAAYLPAAFG